MSSLGSRSTVRIDPDAFLHPTPLRTFARPQPANAAAARPRAVRPAIARRTPTALPGVRVSAAALALCTAWGLVLAANVAGSVALLACAALLLADVAAATRVAMPRGERMPLVWLAGFLVVVAVTIRGLVVEPSEPALAGLVSCLAAACALALVQGSRQLLERDAPTLADSTLAHATGVQRVALVATLVAGLAMVASDAPIAGSLVAAGVLAIALGNVRFALAR